MYDAAMTQLERVHAVMLAGDWMALHEIQDAARSRFGVLDSEAAISARLRDLRAKGHTIARRRRRKTSALREYRMDTPEPGALFETRQTIEQMKRGGA